MNVAVFADTLNYEKLNKSTISKYSDDKLKDEIGDWRANFNKADDAVKQLQQDPKVAEAKKQEDDINAKIENLDDQISDLMAKIDTNKKELDNLVVSIDKAQKDVDAAQKDVDKQQKLMDERVRAVYKTGSTGYLSVVLKSDGFSDLIGRIDVVNKIVNYDKQIKNDLDNKKETLNKKEKDLENKKVEVEKIKKDNENKMNEINSSKDQEQKELDQLKNFIASHDSEYQQDVAAKDIANNNLTALNEESTNRKKLNDSNQNDSNQNDIVPSRGIVDVPKPPSENNSTDTPSTASQSAVVSYAKGCLGIPYLWGGESRSGFDCSGFVQYVYEHFGIDIPRTSSDQSRAGRNVSKSELQPGDLVFFANSGGVHHVGMYIGGGQFIHAPKTGDVIKISSLSSRSDFYCARRFM